MQLSNGHSPDTLTNNHQVGPRFLPVRESCDIEEVLASHSKPRRHEASRTVRSSAISSRCRHNSHGMYECSLSSAAAAEGDFRWPLYNTRERLQLRRRPNQWSYRATSDDIFTSSLHYSNTTLARNPHHISLSPVRHRSQGASHWTADVTIPSRRHDRD